MYQSLNIILRTSFHNPTKLQLINMINLVHSAQPTSAISVNYQIIDTVDQIQMNKVYEKVPNMKLLNHLASINYGDSDINIDTLLKQLT